MIARRRGPIRVGDFRPWIRLLVMLAGIAAVGVAARSLSKRLVEARLLEHVRALMDQDDRVRCPPRALVDLRGLPRPSAAGTLALEPGESSAIEGLVLAPDGGPAAGATVRVIALDGAAPKTLPFGATADALGLFRIEGLAPTGPMGLLVAPKDGGMPLVVERIAEGVPGLATSAGTLVLPRARELRVRVAADRVDARAVPAFGAPPSPLRLDPRALDAREPTVFRGVVPEGLVEIVATRDALARSYVALAGYAPDDEIDLAAPSDPAEPARETAPPRDRFTFAAERDAAAGPSLAGWRLLSAPDDRVPIAAEGERRRELWIAGGVAHLVPPDASTEEPSAAQELAATLASETGEKLQRATALLDLFGSGVCVRGDVETRDGTTRVRFLRVPRGEHVLLAIADGHLPAAEDVSMPPPSGAPPLAIALERAAEVSIRVEDENGHAITGHGLAVRVRAPGGRIADLAVPPTGALRAGRLPPGPLAFELFGDAGVRGGAAGGAWPAPRLEPLGSRVDREVIAGDRNANVTLRLPRSRPAWITAVGRTRPGAWVYRCGARLDEPSTLTRADDAGRFAIVAAQGERLLAAAGSLRALLPFASTSASPTPAFGASSTCLVLVVGRDGKPRPRAQVSARPLPPDGLGHASWTAAAGNDGRAPLEGIAPGVRCAITAADGDASGEVEATAPQAGATVEIRVEVAAP